MGHRRRRLHHFPQSRQMFYPVRQVCFFSRPAWPVHPAIQGYVTVKNASCYLDPGHTKGDWSGTNAGNADFAAVNLDADGAEVWRYQVGFCCVIYKKSLVVRFSLALPTESRSRAYQMFKGFRLIGTDRSGRPICFYGPVFMNLSNREIQKFVTRNLRHAGTRSNEYPDYAADICSSTTMVDAHKTQHG